MTNSIVNFPTIGFVKIPTILSAIPVSKSSWWAGVKSGKYPKPVKHGSSTFWKSSDILALIEEIAAGGQGGNHERP